MSKKTKIFLFTGILFLVFSIIIIGLFVGRIIRHDESNDLTYNDLVYMECTVENVRESGNTEDGYQFYISIVEDEKVIRVNNLLTENKDDMQIQREIDLLKFQINEIESANLSKDEYEDLLKQRE